MNRLHMTGVSFLRPSPGADRTRHGPPMLRPRETGSPPQPARRAPLRHFATPMRIAGIALVLLAAAGYWLVYSGTTQRTPVLVMTHDLPSGAVVHTADVRVGELGGDRSVLGGLMPERELSQVVGRRLATPVMSGAPLPRAALTRPVDTAAQLTLTVPAIRAGSVMVGDRVTVLATYGAATGQARTDAIARGLLVLFVGSVAGGLDRETTTIPVVLAVPDPSIVADLALANDAARISLLIEGKPTTTRIPPASE